MKSQEVELEDSIIGCETAISRLAKFKEGGSAFSLYLMNQLKLRELKTEQGGCCSVVFEFRVESSGKAVFNKIKSNECNITNAENVLKEIIETMPLWKPAIQNGRATAVTFSIPFRVRFNR